MRRLARVIPLARQRVDPLLVKLQIVCIKKWPPHLSIAFELLQRKSVLTDQKILSIIIESVRAAHACAKAINRRSDRTVSFLTRGKLCKTFKLFANCAKRAPLKLQRRLNESIDLLIRDNPVDSDVIENILTTTVAIFLEFPEEEAARTALQLRYDIPVNYDRLAAIKNEYSVLGNAYQRKAEDAIIAIAKSPNKKTIALDVFRGLALALDSSESKRVSAEIHALIVDYMATVANLWRSAGLRPSRVRRRNNHTYISSFHSFGDAVLTAMVEPWSQRHQISVDGIRQKARTDHKRHPAAVRAIAGPLLKRADVFLLVSDDHVKKALRNGFKKNGAKLLPSYRRV